MNEDTKVQDKELEGKPESELHAEPKPAEETQLPEDTKDRTREQFEKLKESNKTLQEKLAALEAKEKQESVLDSLKPKAPPVIPQPKGNAPTASQSEPSLVDQEGYVDATLLQRRLTSAEKRALEAEKKAQEAASRFEKYEETRQIREAHEKYPQLDPSNPKFDQTFYDQTRKELMVQMMNGEKDVVKAAESVTKYYRGVEPNEAAQEDKKAETKEAKANINAGMTKTAPATRYADMDESSLSKRVQKGDRQAFAERMRRAGY